MRTLCVLLLVTLGGLQTALAGEDTSARPKLTELIAQGYEQTASGKLMMRRKLIPPMDMGICVHGCRDASCVGAPIATIDGGSDSCKVQDAWANWARFQRMAKGEVEFVCILYGADECYPVR